MLSPSIITMFVYHLDTNRRLLALLHRSLIVWPSPTIRQDGLQVRPGQKHTQHMLVKSAAASKQQRIAPSANTSSSTTISSLTMYSNDNAIRNKDGKMVGGCWQPIQEETLGKAHHQTPRWLKQTYDSAGQASQWSYAMQRFSRRLPLTLPIKLAIRMTLIGQQ